MKVRILKYLRGPGMVADPGDERDMDAKDAAPLLEAGAVERVQVVERAVEAPAERAVVPEVEKPRPPAAKPKRRGRPRKTAK